MSSYYEKLKDGRWQKKRLEVFERDAFHCQACGVSADDGEVTLHVHHKVYRKGADPWDYELGQLITYCSDCHEAVTMDLSQIRELVGEMWCECQFKLAEFLQLAANRLDDVQLSSLLLLLVDWLYVDKDGLVNFAEANIQDRIEQIQSGVSPARVNRPFREIPASQLDENGDVLW